VAYQFQGHGPFWREAFHFAKPADFQFRAGQSMELTLLNPPGTDAEGNSRAFSIASAPFDNDLMIATRIRNTAFKRVPRKASLGLQVKIDGRVARSYCTANERSRGRVPHAVPEYHPPGGARQIAARHVLVLLQPARKMLRSWTCYRRGPSGIRISI
jgi:hypothetical protein